MKPEINTLINSLYSGNITDQEFIALYFNDSTPDEKHCFQLFQNAILHKDAGQLEEGLVLIHVGAYEAANFVAELCQLLPLDWHYNHEDIAMLLAKIKHPNSVDSLFQSTELQFAYLAYDDTFQFARKCIKALSAIGDENSINKLLVLSESENSTIAAYAKKEINYKGLTE